MTPVWGSDREPELNAYLSQWASSKLFGHTRGFGPCTTMGVFEDGKLVGVMVYHGWEKPAGIIEISGVSDRKEWLKRHVLWEMFSYPFDQLKCQMVVMRVSEKNVQWNGRGLPRLLKAYGFTSIAVPRLYGRDEDGILYCLTDDAWRKNGFHRQHRFAKNDARRNATAFDLDGRDQAAMQTNLGSTASRQGHVAASEVL